MGDKENSISLEIVPGPDIARNLPWNYHTIICLTLISRLNEQSATRREQDSMGHTIRWENATDPSERIANEHRHRDVLESEDDHHEEAS